MELLLYENSKGFSNYTSKLCNAIVEHCPNVKVSYMTQKNNNEIVSLHHQIDLIDVLNTYSNSKKYSFEWLKDRVMSSTGNIIARNKLCERKAFDVVCVQATIPIIDQFFISKLKRQTKVVYTAHDVIPPVKSFYYSKHSLRRLYNEVDHIIVHSEINKEQLQDIFQIDRNKISVICHGTDVEYKREDKTACRKRFGIAENKKILLFYGMIREQKGLDDLIQGLSGIDNIQLVIAGNMPYGETFNRYDQLIQAYNIDCVKMIQFIPNEWTDELFQACDAVCLPYKYFYSQSGVFMQSIKYRKPVVVSDVSCFSEYINKYNMGVLCKPRDPDSIHRATKCLLQQLDEDRTQIESGLNTAAIENSWEQSALQYYDCIKRL